MKRKLLLILILSITCYFSFIDNLHADTIRMMQYNLMYYTVNGPDGCDENTNNLDTKDAALKSIIQYAKPDVFCVNEIGKESTYTQRILNNALNVDGANYYKSCPTVSSTGAYITIGNMLFYDSRKLELHSTFYVPTSVTYFNGYKMYLKNERLALGDTVFITFIVAHLKAGQYDSNADSRYTQVQSLMARLSAQKPGNIVLSGDFNLYGASEKAYQHLIHFDNSLYRFCDPLDREEEWHDNRSCSSIHTQSTHSWGDCFSGGGFDDRFDFILVSPYILYGSQKVKSINSSYRAIGQDGNQFNSQLNISNNRDVPQEVAEALYNMSDHLPIMLDFNIKTTTGISSYVSDLMINVVNPMREEELAFDVFSPEAQKLNFRIVSMEGKVIDTFEEVAVNGNNHFKRAFPYPASIYFLQVYDKAHNIITKKIVKL